MPNEIMTFNEVCEYLKISRVTLSKKIKENKIKYKNITGTRNPIYRFKREWIEEYLNGNS